MEKLDFKSPLHFKEFPPTSTEEWETVIEADLKGKDYKEILRWESEEGVEPLPFYRKEHLEDLAHAPNPVRKSGRWSIVELIENADIESANEQALHALENGSSGLKFSPPENFIHSKKDLKQLLENIQIDIIALHFGSTLSTPEISKWLQELCEEQQLDFDSLDITFSFDPFAQGAQSGKLVDKSSIEHIFERFGDSFKSSAVDASVYGNAGATVIQQLAFALASGNELLGLNPKLHNRIHFNFSIGPNYFLEIAKFRAFKLCWAQILSEYELENIDPLISAETGLLNKSKTDAHNNMLRCTTEAMSAALGGCDSITVFRYDKHFEEHSNFASRIARNTQLILQEEAYLDKVADPGAGSYYIEVLTDAISKESWNLFQEIEQNGGMHECLKKQYIQDMISKSREKKIQSYREQEKVMVGVNKYTPKKMLDVSINGQETSTSPSIAENESFTEIEFVPVLNIEAELQKGEAS